MAIAKTPIDSYQGIAPLHSQPERVKPRHLRSANCLSKIENQDTWS